MADGTHFEFRKKDALRQAGAPTWAKKTAKS